MRTFASVFVSWMPCLARWIFLFGLTLLAFTVPPAAQRASSELLEHSPMLAAREGLEA
jgi:hypothetical protein